MRTPLAALLFTLVGSPLVAQEAPASGAHAAYRAGPFLDAAQDLRDALAPSARAEHAPRLAGLLLRAGRVEAGFAVSLEVRGFPERLALWTGLLDELYDAGDHVSARSLLTRVRALEGPFDTAGLAEEWATLVHDGLARTGRVDDARAFADQQRAERGAVFLLHADETHRAFLGGRFEALHGSESTAAARLEKLRADADARALADEVEVALCVRPFREGRWDRGGARHEVLEQADSTRSGALWEEAERGRVRADLERGRTEDALKRAGRLAKQYADNTASRLAMDVLLAAGDLAGAREAFATMSRRDSAGWRAAATRLTCAEIEAGSTLEGLERIEQLGELERGEVLEVARALIANGQAGSAQELAGESAALAQGIDAIVLGANRAETEAGAWSTAVAELSASMSERTVWPRLELVAMLAERGQPRLGLPELDRVLRAAVEDSLALPEDRARVLELEFALRGGFGVELELERLGSSPETIAFVLDAAEAALRAGLEP